VDFPLTQDELDIMFGAIQDREMAHLCASNKELKDIIDGLKSKFPPQKSIDILTRIVPPEE